MPTTLHTCDIARCMTTRWHHCSHCGTPITQITEVDDAGLIQCEDCTTAIATYRHETAARAVHLQAVRQADTDAFLAT